MKKSLFLFLRLVILSVVVFAAFERKGGAFGGFSLPEKSISIEKLGFEFHYQFEKDNTITIGLSIRKPQKYFALGLRKQVPKSDMWLFHFEGGKLTVEDYYVDSKKAPIKDVDLGGTDDVNLLDYKEGTETLLVKLSRKLRTGDRYDRDIAGGNNDFYFSYGNNIADITDDSHVNTFKVTLVNDKFFIKDELEDRHGLLSIICWGFLVDVGILLLRYLRLHKTSFNFRLPHAIIMATNVIVSTYAMFLMFWKNWDEGPFFGFPRWDMLVDSHMAFGYIATIGAPLIAAGGIMTFFGIRIQGINIRDVHIAAGYIMYLLTKFNVLLGGCFHGDGKWRPYVLGYLGVIIVLHMIISSLTIPPRKDERMKIH